MEIKTESIRPNNVCVCVFYGVKRDTIGEIDLILTIGTMDFKVTFQVLDMDTSYNFLLGRRWIHAAGVVPSTLHQMVKFEHENQEIVIHGEDEQPIYRDPSVPCLKSREGSEHIVYLAFEIVVVDQCEEGTLFPQPFLSNALIMITSEMIKYGYKPGKRLRVSLQGATEPITLTVNKKFFGIGFQATDADVKWADEHKKWMGPALDRSTSRQVVCEAKVLMDEEDVEKTTFTTSWGTYCYREIEVYVDDVFIKSRMQEDHVRDLRKFFERLRKYDLKLNPTKCAFGVPCGKLLGFIKFKFPLFESLLKLRSRMMNGQDPAGIINYD
ncbi:uncharacterized protein LOC142163203 [Nicotiana tabacum]|uniref:Uncharacterized protein LOC142163203 n=1 Tax=Nicotiana tabacum TaxID=4097 RepID=A0AC58RV12_TOBAC